MPLAHGQRVRKARCVWFPFLIPHTHGRILCYADTGGPYTSTCIPNSLRIHNHLLLDRLPADRAARELIPRRALVAHAQVAARQEQHSLGAVLADAAKLLRLLRLRPPHQLPHGKRRHGASALKATHDRYGYNSTPGHSASIRTVLPATITMIFIVTTSTTTTKPSSCSTTKGSHYHPPRPRPSLH
jgi:hypothetical protein